MFADTLDRAQFSCIPSPYCDQPEQFLNQTRLFRHHLSPETKTVIQKLATGAFTHYQFADIPITKKIPPTPDIYPPPQSSPPYEVEGVIGCIAQRLGQVFGYLENCQHLIYDIYPVRGYEQSNSFINSRKMLGFHSDGSAHPKLIPDYTLLFCVRNDPLSINLIANVDDVIRKLPERLKDELFEPNFLHLVSQDPLRTIRKPILYFENKTLAINYDEATVSGIDERSTAALESLNQASRQSAMRIRNYNNSLLVLNNKRCLHARTSFIPMYNGQDRWIKGTYVCRAAIKNGTILAIDS